MTFIIRYEIWKSVKGTRHGLNCPMKGSNKCDYKKLNILMDGIKKIVMKCKCPLIGQPMDEIAPWVKI